MKQISFLSYHVLLLPLHYSPDPLHRLPNELALLSFHTQQISNPVLHYHYHHTSPGCLKILIGQSMAVLWNQSMLFVLRLCISVQSLPAMEQSSEEELTHHHHYVPLPKHRLTLYLLPSL